jgi:HD-GYP domain-containing protein (c-di-GMP phosphodiesterase class II)
MSSSYEEIVTLLSNGICQRKLYFSNHPRVLEISKEFAEKLGSLLQHLDKDFFFLGVVKGNLVHNGRYLVGPTIVGRRLVDYAVSLCSGGFLYRQNLESQEVCEFFNLAAELTEPVQSLEEARGMMNARGIAHIELSPSYEEPGWFGRFLFEGDEAGEAGGVKDVGEEDPDSIIPVYQSLFNTVENMHSLAGSDKELDMAETRTAAEEMLDATQDNFTDMMQLVRYPNYDTYTVGHSVRVALIAVLVGHRMGMEHDFLIELGSAGLLHDVGKAKVPHDILYKQGRLNEEERRLIQSHPGIGAQILLETRDSGSLTVAAAWGHHLRHDGEGYPATAPWAIRNPTTAMLHVCDVFEALTAMRPYKRDMTPRRAYEIMLQDPGAFDPGALTTFISAMGLYPPGSKVRLSTGEGATVVAAGQVIEKPKVRITHGELGEELPPNSVRLLDLSGEEGQGVSVTMLLLDRIA